jgi:hypothetical protein
MCKKRLTGPQPALVWVRDAEREEKRDTVLLIPDVPTTKETVFVFAAQFEFANAAIPTRRNLDIWISKKRPAGQTGSSLE